MSFQPSRTRAGATNYKLAMLILAVVMTLAAILALVPSYRTMLIDIKGLAGPVPTIYPAPSPTPASAGVSQPTPITNLPQPTPQQHQVCGRWRSQRSEKTYDFICHSATTFQVRQVDDAGGENTGTGTVAPDGQEVQAQILIARNNRTAYLRLRLSSDGQRLDGSWSGNAAVETGAVSFHRVQP